MVVHRRSRNHQRRMRQHRHAHNPISNSEPHVANEATSLVINALNRISEFLRFDQRNNSEVVQRVVFDESDSANLEENDPCKILIERSDVSKIVFQCQLAQGSPTALISEFNNPTELYQKIADSYDGIFAGDILFCTRNTHRIDMDAVFSGSLATSDFIFAHVCGQKKEVELIKTARTLGVTLSDNWSNRVFIRKIHPDSQVANSFQAVQVGDNIERINGESMIGKRHFQVANVLRSLPLGKKFTLRLISPLKSGFSFVSAPQRFTPKRLPLAGPSVVQTIRFKSVCGKAVLEEPPNAVIISRINDLFDNFLGFNDEELATTVIEISENCTNISEMEDCIKKSSLCLFEFTPEFVFELWGVIDDWRCNRLMPLTTTKSQVSAKNENIDTDETEENVSYSSVISLEAVYEDANDELNSPILPQLEQQIDYSEDDEALPPPPPLQVNTDDGKYMYKFN